MVAALKIKHNKSRAAGQAMVELAVGLVVILVLFAGLIQIGRLANAHTQTMITARENAGYAAMSDELSDGGATAYILSWGVGPDGKSYTADDLLFPAPNAAQTVQAIASVASSDELADFLPGNTLSETGDGIGVTNIFFFVYGEGRAPVSTFPVIRSLIYNRPAIYAESQAWLVWTKGIY